ncbi:MAG: hypothetical protein ABIU09_04365 [Pyrinomonadaceae bacterium]
MEKTGIFTPPAERFDTTWMVATATVYRTILSIAGCYIVGAGAFPIVFPIVVGTLLWVELYLSDERLRAVVPIRS